MTGAIVMTCPLCGAPLPERAVKDSAAQPFVTCAYCRATSSLSGGRSVEARTEAASPSRLFSDVDFFQEVAAAFRGALDGGASPHDALVAAARSKLGGMQGEAFARVCLALARDFDREHGTETVRDAQCMARLINVYLLAIEGVRTSGRYVANMPFFTATPQGPVHFERTLTAESIAALAQVEPAPVRTAASAQPQVPAGPPVKKRRFWPFG